MDAVRMGTLIYYRVKYLKNPNAFSDILENINYVDKRLESTGIRIYNKRIQNVFTTYSIGNISVHLTVMYLIYSKTRNTELIYNTIREFVSLYNIILKTFSYFSILFFVMHISFTMYTIGDRMRLVRCAIQQFKEIGLRQSAWDCESGFSAAIGFRNLKIKQDNYLKQANTLHKCLCNVFYTANRLYKHFIYTSLIISVIGSSISIMILATRMNGLNFFLLLDHFVQFNIIPMYFSMFMANELQGIKCAVCNLYYRSDSKSLNNKKKSFYFHCLHVDNRFDCGYFKVEWTLLSVVFNSYLYLYSLCYSNKVKLSCI